MVLKEHRECILLKNCTESKKKTKKTSHLSNNSFQMTINAFINF